MQKPSIPDNEAERMEAVHAYQILDTEPEPAFDALTTLAAHIAGVPIALVTIVDTDRQWFKSRYGLDAPETPRDVSFCGHVVATTVPLVVPNSFDDPRFCDNPLVTGYPQVVFYAGVPLKTPEGLVLGTLCAIDAHPRELSPEQMHMLTLLGQQVVDQLELRRRNIQLLSKGAELERALRQTETLNSRLQSILDSANHAILEMTPEGIIRVFNRAAQRMLGFTAEEVVDVTSPLAFFCKQELVSRAKALSAEFGLEVKADFQAVVGLGSQLEDREWHWVDSQGRRFPVQLTITARRDAAGEILGYLGIASDISQRKRAERVKAEFVSTVSHELRTPLTSIRGALGLLAGGVLGELPAEADEFLGIAISNADRLVRLINDILDIEKMQAGSMEFRLKTLPLADLLKQALAANLGLAKQNGLTLEFSGEAVQGEALADEDRLTQVVCNLVSNAVKYSPPGGVVRVRLLETSDFLRVEVADQGPGIPEEFRPRVFQRFAQADSSTTRQKGGSGLGLSISQAIVENLQGRIGFEHPPEGGALFFFELPRVEPLEHCLQTDPEQDLALICEDDLDVSRVLSRILHGAGFTTHVAPTLERARALLSKNSYRVMTLDFTLADGDGRSLLSEVRSSSEHSRLPVIVISGSLDGSGEWDAGALEVVDILPKPFDQSRLQEALRIALQATEGVPSILHVEDDPDVAQIIGRLLPSEWDVSLACNLKSARQYLRTRSFDVVLLDLSLPDGQGSDLLNEVGQARVVIFSALEASQELSKRVALVLTKTRTSEEGLRQRLTGLVSRYKLS